jgi:hypothetical protein
MGDELQKPDKPSWGRVALTGLKFFALGLAFLLVMFTVGAVLLVGFLVYACGHH